MKLSANNKQRLYNAIREPIMTQRLDIQNADGMLHRKDVDDLLFKIERKVWREVAAVLNIEVC